MSEAGDARALAHTQDQIQTLAQHGRYHSIQLANGTILPGLIPLERLERRWELLGIPEDLRGRSVLDVGCWDGWFSHRAWQLGANVTALDLVENAAMHELLTRSGAGVQYEIRSVYSLLDDHRRFDFVLFLGVLYHLRHPLLGLEAICAATLDTAYIETYVSGDDDSADAMPSMEFYEGIELRGQMDNWCGPNVACVLAMARAAGFAEVHYLGRLDERAHFRASRKVAPRALTEKISENDCRIRGVADSIHNRYLLETHTDAFASIWCDLAPSLQISERILSVRFEGLDSVPVSITKIAEGQYQLVTKVPPGLGQKIVPLHLRVDGHRASPDFHVAVGFSEFHESRLNIQPGREIWILSLVDAAPGHLSIWLREATPTLTLQSLSVRFSGIDLSIDYLSPPNPDGSRQVNCRLPRGLHAPCVLEVQISIWHYGNPVDVASYKFLAP